MRVLVRVHTGIRLPERYRIRVQRTSRAKGLFISQSETLLGVILLTLSMLVLHWILVQSPPSTDGEAPVSASARRA